MRGAEHARATHGQLCAASVSLHVGWLSPSFRHGPRRVRPLFAAAPSRSRQDTELPHAPKCPLLKMAHVGRQPFPQVLFLFLLRLFLLFLFRLRNTLSVAFTSRLLHSDHTLHQRYRLRVASVPLCLAAVMSSKRRIFTHHQHGLRLLRFAIPVRVVAISVEAIRPFLTFPVD